METAQKSDQLLEIQRIITKMPLEVCCNAVLPELDLRWKEVSKAVRNCRLPMQSSSVARVLCQYLTKSATQEELNDILSRLRLKLVAHTSHKWHLIHLQEPMEDESRLELVDTLPQRVLSALRQKNNKSGVRPEVQSMAMGDLIYLSLQFKSEGSVLYIAVPVGQPVALLSYLATDKVLKACAKGLGYNAYTRADLHGYHIPSLVRVACGAALGPAAHAPHFDPAPKLTATGIDYTQRPNEYLDSLIGPDPPLLTELNLKTSCRFGNKTMRMSLQLKSDSLATSFKAWALNGAISPTSDFFKIIQRHRANNLTYARSVGSSDSDSD